MSGRIFLDRHSGNICAVRQKRIEANKDRNMGIQCITTIKVESSGCFGKLHPITTTFVDFTGHK